MHNPFASPLFVPSAQRFAALLVVGVVLVLAAERRRLRHPGMLRESVLLRRVGSWAMMAPTFLVSVLCGGPVALALVLLHTVQGLREFSSGVGLRRDQARLLLVLGAAAVVAASVSPAMVGALPLAGFGVLGVAAIARGEVDGAWRELTAALFGYLWLPLTLAFLPVIARAADDGSGVLLALGVAVALSDVAAFCTGSLLGGPRLASRISPNKTIAGALGNLGGAAAGVCVMGFGLPPGWSVPVRAALAVTVAGAAVGGDLLESLVKRTFAVKDAGTLLPGFGGLLDRIDSLVVALPVTYAVLRLAG